MNDLVTDTQLAALEKLAQAATPGPWVVYTDSNFDGHQIESEDGVERIVCPETSDGVRREEDAEYIAAANPAVMLGLIDELRQARRERDWVIERVLVYGDLCPYSGQHSILGKDCMECWRKAAREAACLMPKEAKAVSCVVRAKGGTGGN